MEKITRAYESIFVVNCTLPEEDMRATIEKFTTLIGENATDVKVTEWGKKRLAYPINDMPEGFYVMVEFVADTQFVAELERVYHINENIMRSLTVAKGE